MIINVNVFPQEVGYIAQSELGNSMWSKGATMDETISNFKRDYASMCKMQFQDGNIEFDFHVKLKG